jgi:hypothetical protein
MHWRLASSFGLLTRGFLALLYGLPKGCQLASSFCGAAGCFLAISLSLAPG